MRENIFLANRLKLWRIVARQREHAAFGAGFRESCAPPSDSQMAGPVDEDK